MADLSKLNENISTLSTKVDELIAKAAAAPVDHSQEEIDALDARVQEILARIP